MTDEPWEQELQRVAGDRWPTYLYSLAEAREICARVWREAQMESLRLRSTAPPREVDAQDTPLHRFMAHQNTRAAAAEAQRDRLAAAGQAVCDGVLKSMTGIPLMWLGEPALAVRPAVIDALRAALAGEDTNDSRD